MIPLITTFLSNNLKPLIYVVIVVFIGVFAYKAYTIIQENAKYEQLIEIQQVSIKNIQDQNEKLKVTIQLNEKLIAARDVEINNLEEKTKNITNNLGKDENDNAPESIKELIRRLNK